MNSPNVMRFSGCDENPSNPFVRFSAPALCFLFVTALSGCTCGTEQRVTQDLIAFRSAGPVRLTIDKSKLVLATKPSGTYRVVRGDVVDFDMPRVMATIVQDVVQPNQRIGRHRSRVDSSGQVTVPLIGAVDAAGLTLLELEEKLVEMYYPKYLKFPPSIVSKVDEYFTEPVTILGAIKTPGTYQLRREEMSLVTLLSKAGGVGEAGAKTIRIKRQFGENQSTYPDDTIFLPVEGLDIDFIDVALRAGDIVEVERLEPRRISVIGLVNKPGVFPFNPRTEYTLLDSIALAGGLNVTADPKFATVYRLDQSGYLVAAKFRITGGRRIMQAAATPLKPGDVVAVEHTIETNIRLIIAQMVRVGFGFGGNVAFF